MKKLHKSMTVIGHSKKYIFWEGNVFGHRLSFRSNFHTKEVFLSEESLNHALEAFPDDQSRSKFKKKVDELKIKLY